jgi:pimeloyl-ACP methyl ester carboxylesterase
VTEPPSVLIAHGLWLTGLEAALLRHRLGLRGFAVHQFHYHSVTARVPEVVEALRQQLLALPPPVHLVGHSLGGLLVLRLTEAYPELPLGRVVLLGAPVNGSRSARAFARLPGAAFLLGSLADAELLHQEPRRWRHPADIGVIAGTHSVGLGRVLGALPEPNDGAVAVDETHLEGATQHLVLPVSHLGMLVAEQVVGELANFLDCGRFSAAAA